MLTIAAIHDIEEKIMTICNSSKNLEDILSAGKPLWDWACQETGSSLENLRHQIEFHETDEQFPNEYLEEKDHLLKLPLVLLEHYHSKSQL